MIRIANEADFLREITSESELRVCALQRAYGLDARFIQFFADDEGSIASLMDGVLSLHCANGLNDEWRVFIAMHPDIRIIHTVASVATALAKDLPASLTQGQVYTLSNASSEMPLQKIEANYALLREIYSVLSEVFGGYSPFDSWYVDISHRVRHGCCHIATESADDCIISTVMTVAETEKLALIGGVATLPKYRGQGIASRCIARLLRELPQERILIAPDNEDAARLYKRLGFTPWGTWAELTFPN